MAALIRRLMPKSGSAGHAGERPHSPRGVRSPSLYAVLSLGVFGVASYLSLVNLDYVALWHDEAPTAILGNTLLERGIPSGWDGRNLVGGVNGRTLNADLIDTLPPLAYVLERLWNWLYSDLTRVGARIMHALAGVLSLGFLYLLLREHLQKYTRVWSSSCSCLLLGRHNCSFTFVNLGITHLWCLAWLRPSTCTSATGGPRTIVHLVLLDAGRDALIFQSLRRVAQQPCSRLPRGICFFAAKETTRREYLQLGLGSVVVVAV